MQLADIGLEILIGQVIPFQVGLKAYMYLVSGVMLATLVGWVEQVAAN